MNKMISSVALLAITCNVLMAGGDIVPVEPVVPEVVVSDSWEYSVSLALWSAGVEGETADGDDIDVSFSDLLDNLDFGYMGNFGAQKGKWTFRTDVMYMKLGVKPNEDLGGQILTNFKMKSWIVTPTVAYRVIESEQLDLDIVAGARYLYLKPTIGVDYVEMTDSDSIWDGIVGLRGQYNLNEKWFMPFNFDAGSGDADLVWQAFAGVGYKYENFDLVAGYRHMAWDFEGDKVLNDFSFGGPIIGTMFKF